MNTRTQYNKTMTIETLNYFKMILEKVCFNAQLFEKELKKAIAQLQKTELLKFKKWCIQKFGELYLDIIKKAFLVVYKYQFRRKLSIKS